MTKEIEAELECIFCNKDVPDEGEYVPEVADDDEWERLAQYHDEDCEWVATRAHRVWQSSAKTETATVTRLTMLDATVIEASLRERALELDPDSDWAVYLGQLADGFKEISLALAVGGDPREIRVELC